MSHTPQGTGGTCTACAHNDRSVVILCPLHKAAPALVAALELIEKSAGFNGGTFPAELQHIAREALRAAKGREGK